MKISRFLFVLFFVVLSIHLKAQTDTKNINVLFYNVENLFDFANDPQKADDEFTPEGARHWNNNRFNTKLINLSKVILNVSGWNPPEIIGLCETENRTVLEKLLHQTPLKKYPYNIIHKDSPDERGIDVAFIYNEKAFYPITYQYYPLEYADGSIEKSREILYVQGILRQTDTLHFYVNHWPSRYSGLLETSMKRELAATALKSLVDEQLKQNENAKIIVMGDFNDQPTDESISNKLNAVAETGRIKSSGLYNLSTGWMNKETGTLKYQSQWFVFDQFIVSGSLLISENGYTTGQQLAAIGKLPFLLEKDERYGGEKPSRTYTGFKYNGGFSDHLPILLKLTTSN